MEGVKTECGVTLKIISMKNLMIILSRSRFSAALLLAGSGHGLATIASAADATAPAAARTTTGELKAMDAFLDAHAVLDDQLRQHPGLANDPEFLKNHPEYAAFLSDHPKLAEQVKDHPRYFVQRALTAQRKQPITPAEVKKLDAFLDQHPEVEKDLEKNPKLADDPKFVAAHPELRKFLNEHPKVNGALASKPKATIQREKRLDKREAKAGKT